MELSPFLSAVPATDKLLLGVMVSELWVPEASRRLPLDCAPPPQEIWRRHLCPVPQFQGHHDMFHLIYSVYFM